MNRDKPEDAWISHMKAKLQCMEPPKALKQKVMEQIALCNIRGEVLAAVRIDQFQADDAIDRIIQTLEPGMGKAIYIQGQNERTVNQQTNYKAVRWESDIQSLLERCSPYRLLLPAHAQLLEIRVYYGFNNLSAEEIDAMAMESIRTGQPIIVRDLQPNDDVVGINLTYSQQGQPIEYRIFKTTKSRIHVPNLSGQHIERTAVRGQDAVYMSDSGRQHLIWAEEESGAGKAVQYELIARNDDREWLFRLANSVAAWEEEQRFTT